MRKISVPRASPAFSHNKIPLTPARNLILAAAILVASSACFAGDIVVENAWVRMPPPAAMSLAGYMTVTNRSDQELSITSVSSADFEMCMIHQTVVEDDIAKMKHHKTLSIPAGDHIDLEPNGYHLMLMRPTRQFTAGDEITLNIGLDSGESMNIVLPVRAMTP